MLIQMAGIDFCSADLSEREVFAFTKSQVAQGMHLMKSLPGIDGCVIVSTCNRTELWLCSETDGQADPAALLCSLKKVSKEYFLHLITVRSGKEAVRHLFETSCGLRSRIWGEDQIITQIKDAVSLSTAEGTAGKVLSKLFQTAVTSAKKIKTEVYFRSGNASVATAAVEKYKELGEISGCRCLVIGSGKMGQLAAKEFAANGARVTMTIRQYKSGISVIPEKCKSVLYEGRLNEVQNADIIISATSSPHYTLHFEPVTEICSANPKSRVFIDLAVPRDIEPRIGELPNCTLLSIDDIPCHGRSKEKALVEAQCSKIIDHYIGEFERQLIAWSTLPEIQTLSMEFSASIQSMLKKILEEENVPLKEQDRIIARMEGIAQKKAGKMLFNFRDWIEDNAQPQKALLSEYAEAIE